MGNDANRVPLMFQAQVEGRSQIQRLNPKSPQQQAYDWARQWIEGCDAKNVPQFAAHVQTKSYQFTWRMVTNSGQDAGLIRPVIGDRGWAYFPGSSMKGAFRRACTCEEKLRYCGGETESELHPGILRFHGGYPKTDRWLNNSLVDVVHPQEDWQVKEQAKHSALIQISLYQPAFEFGISSSEPLGEDEWSHIWEIWQRAIEQGLGSRVSAGYGQIKTHSANKLLSIGLSGEGICSLRIDKQPEFRPNGFKAALRGHTRRLFSGVTDDATAEKITRQLWGGFENGKPIVGLLGISYSAPDLDITKHNNMPVYQTGNSELTILLMREVTESERKALGSFVTQLIKFAMLLGGFGKSWRRVNHQIFMPDYEKYMIGCHWEFTRKSEKFYVPIDSQFKNAVIFLDKLNQTIANFYLLKQLPAQKPARGNLREVWQKDNVQVWGRIAQDEDDIQALKWLHGEYQPGKSIKGSELTGKMGKIGRLWHRMYPRFVQREGELRDTNQLVEFLTIFPNHAGSPEEVRKTKDFLMFLENSSEFKRLW